MNEINGILEKFAKIYLVICCVDLILWSPPSFDCKIVIYLAQNWPWFNNHAGRFGLVFLHNLVPGCSLYSCLLMPVWYFLKLFILKQFLIYITFLYTFHPDSPVNILHNCDDTLFKSKKLFIVHCTLVWYYKLQTLFRFHHFSTHVLFIF